MTNEEKNRIYNEMVKFVADPKIDIYSDIDQYKIYAMFFHRIGTARFLSTDGGKPVFLKKTTESLTIFEPDKNGIMVNKNIDCEKTLSAIVEKLDAVVLPFRNDLLYIVGDHVVLHVITDREKGSKIDHMCMVTEENYVDELSDAILSSIVPSDAMNDKNTYRIAYRGQYSIETTVCEFDDWNTDIAKNYNDDVPFKEMNDIIRMDKASLMLLYGKPGTGKTSIIKSLINENPDKNFIFIDTSMFSSLSDGRFLDFMEENRGGVIVFEDCERLLSSRKNGENNELSTILNLTDGLIAETMKLKFICTFNCDIATIDEAALRKGRLTLKYEFKELSMEKTKVIYPDAVRPMTLGDAYNANVKNDFSEPQKAKIGFVK